MSKKRKKRRRTPKPVTAVAPATVDEQEAGEPDEEEASAGRRATLAPSPFPPLAESMARGMRAVGASPATLAIAFLTLLAIWGVLVAMGTAVQPGILSMLASAPPAHLFFIDVPAALTTVDSTPAGLGVVLALVTLRALTFGLLISMVVETLRGGRSNVRAALVQLPRLVPRMVILYVVEVAAVVFAQLVVSAFLPQLSTLAAAVGLYFLVFAAIVVVAEDIPVQEVLRRSLRAARLPGTRHLTIVMAYFIVVTYTPMLAPIGPAPPATPSIAAWAFALAITFVHVAVLAAFAFRWLEVRDEVAQGRAGRGG